MSEKTNKTLTEYLQESADRQPLKAYCALCPDWEAVGTAEETREAAQQHRAEHHPETFRKTKSAKAKRKFSQRNLTRQQEEELERERRARLRVLGIEP